MKSIDVAFVILHFNNIDDTIDTVSSITNRIDTASYHIVIVDNASPNRTGLLLLERYSNDDHIHIILNDKNLGFSAGNNVGINYIKNNFDSEFIVLSNNDIFLYDIHFVTKTRQCFERTNFAVMGPMVMTGDGRCDSNPISDEPYSRVLCKSEIKQFHFYLRLYRLKLLKLYFYLNYYYKKTFPFLHNNKKIGLIKSYDKGIFLKERNNIVLHGCFLIFSKKYFEFFSGLDERTFMYSEENILFRHIMSKGLLMSYCPDVIIYHKVGSSVAKAYSNNIETLAFKYKTKIESHLAYIKLLDELGIK